MDNIKITIETNAEQASKSFEDLAKSFNDTDTQAIDLRKQIKALKAELYTLTPGTEEYGRVLQDLGAKMNQLSDTQQELRVSTGGLDTVFQSTTQATATMASGFQAVSGVMALFGGDADELQKTFVKLQAIMSITTGLKGFAAFGKMTKRASISLKAYINQVRLARTATQQQATATTTLATAEGAASGAALGLSGAIKSVTAAIAANPIGAVLVAITAAITAITHFVGAAKEAREQTEKYNDVLEKSKGTHKTFIEQLEEANKVTDRRISRLKALGTSEEELNKIRKESLELTASQLRHQKQILESNIELHKSNTKMAESLEKWASELDEVNSKLKDTQDELNGMQDVKLPDFVSSFNTAFSALDKNLSRQVTAGIITESQKIRQEIEAYKDEIENLQKTLNDAKIKRDLPLNSPSVNTELDAIITDVTVTISRYQTAINNLNESLKDQGAKAVKTSRDELNKMTDNLSKAFEEFKTKLESELDIYGSLERALGKDTAQARMSGVINSWRYSFTEMTTKIIQEAKKSGKLLNGDMNKLMNQIGKYQEKYYEILNDKNFDFGGWPPGVELMEIRLKALSNDFTEMNSTLSNQLKEGTITMEEYSKWVTKAMEKFIEDRTKMLSEAKDTIKYSLAEMDITDDEKERLKAQWTELFNFSAELLPPDEAKKINDAIGNALQMQLDIIEREYSEKMSDFNAKLQEEATGWMKGKSDAGIFFHNYFGDSPTKQLRDAQDYAQSMYKILYDEYTAELELIKAKMSLLDENSDAYKTYAEKIKQIESDLATAESEYQAAQIENIKEHGQRVTEIAGQFGDAIGGLASAMGSYYAEQAEWAKETYGENSAEYQKYLKKEGNMKIAQVWTDFATGVMTAWATSEQLGPIAGPIMAAIQTAALTATAIASTAQIKRQTKASNNGGASTANVGQLTDRVIMADAQRADQTAELNAKYNQGATRVYVTQGDIQDANNDNRVAVTQNRF